MSDPTHQPQTEGSDGLAALVTWIVVLTAALVALSRGWRPSIALTQSDALPCIAATAAGLAALLFPALVRSWRLFSTAAGVVVAMLALAGRLDDADWRLTATASGIVCGWLLALRVWAPVFPSPRKSLLGNAIAAIVCIGGALTHYFGAEFAAGRWSSVSPIKWAWDSSCPHFDPLIAAIALVGLLLLRLAFSGFFYVVRRQDPQVIHT
jgi:hypothetical protein